MVRSFPVILLTVALLVAASCGKSGDFRHAAHVTVTEGECAPCHGSDPAAPRPAVDGDCAACHRQARESSPSGAGRYGVGKGPPEAARPRARGAAKFPHAPHAAAGMTCLECHDASKWRGNRFVLPAAEDCEACHSGTPKKGADVRRPEAADGHGRPSAAASPWMDECRGGHGWPGATKPRMAGAARGTGAGVEPPKISN